MTQTMKSPATVAFLAASLVVFSSFEVGATTTVTVEFVPPNDPSGAITSTNSNDGYFLGRGVVFEMSSDQTLSEVGILADLTNVDLSYEVAQTLVSTGAVTPGQTVLRSGSQTVTTNGLEWVDFSFPELVLEAGNSYHIEFSHAGSGNQNFFYFNQNVTFSQSSFDLLDGTQFGNTENFFMPAIRVVIPEPSALVLAALGLVCIACRPGKQA